ncbi:glucose-6-phosphate isomerase [Bordetella pertussis]|nr:glucose-6-phosphate isomerase [Bordetella pertussis]
MLRQVDPRAVGALLALYEHKAFVQAAPPEAGPVDWGHDSSTAFWIDRYREQGGAGAAAGRTA